MAIIASGKTDSIDSENIQYQEAWIGDIGASIGARYHDPVLYDIVRKFDLAHAGKRSGNQ